MRETIQTSDGDCVLDRYTDFPSRYASPRIVDVWCPPDYTTSDKHYPVIYVHDGQNLFDPATSLKTNVDWGIDETITRLMLQKQFPGAIVVGVWHPPARRPEYMPQKFFDTVTQDRLRDFAQREGCAPVSDRYLEMLVHEIKPHIDANYRTLPDQAHTFVMGSSMGGLASLYALIEYPHIFGGAGCLSTHWVIGGNELVDYLGARLPKPGSHKLYFDYGTETLDAEYEPFQLRMDAWLTRAGYRHGHDWLTQKFPGADHSERAWRARVHLPLTFLLMGDLNFDKASV